MSEEKMTFEKSLEKLEEIVRTLESGRKPLDESINLYEEGVRLVKSCEGMLDDVEKRIKLLRPDANGEMQETEFVSEDNE